MPSSERPVPVEVIDLAVDLDGRRVLWDISFTVREGHFLGIIGPNGAGKTTLLRAILGLVPAAAGSIRVFGAPPERLGARAHLIGYVPQRVGFDSRFPLSVRDVVMMGRTAAIGMFRFPQRSDWKRVDEVIERVGLAGIGKRSIGALSGGQQQRVLLARALCGGTRMVILDEPTTGLDLPSQEEFYALLMKLRAELELTVIAVSHDLVALANYADELACINGTMHVHGRPRAVLESHQLQEAYRCEFDFLSHDVLSSKPGEGHHHRITDPERRR